MPLAPGVFVLALQSIRAMCIGICRPETQDPQLTALAEPHRSPLRWDPRWPPRSTAPAPSPVWGVRSPRRVRGVPSGHAAFVQRQLLGGDDARAPKVGMDAGAVLDDADGCW